jgi:hypothetical protein
MGVDWHRLWMHEAVGMRTIVSIALKRVKESIDIQYCYRVWDHKFQERFGVLIPKAGIETSEYRI